MSARGRDLRFKPWKNPDKFSYEPIRIMQCACWKCGFVTRYPLEHAEDAETKEWRDAYERLMGLLNQAIADTQLRFGTDPMAIMFVERMMKIRKELGLTDEGDEWKCGTKYDA